MIRRILFLALAPAIGVAALVLLSGRWTTTNEQPPACSTKDARCHVDLPNHRSETSPCERDFDICMRAGVRTTERTPSGGSIGLPQR